MSTPLRVRALSEAPQGPLVALVGDLDLATADELPALLGDCRGRVVLDLADVAFCDSSGLTALLHEQDRLRQGGGDLLVRTPPASLVTLLRVLGLEQLLPVEQPGADRG